jgi:hypothetical protein
MELKIPFQTLPPGTYVHGKHLFLMNPRSQLEIDYIDHINRRLHQQAERRAARLARKANNDKRSGNIIGN